jgi:hypothetical protein
LRPFRIVEIQVGPGSAQLVVGFPGTPGANEIHDGRG